MLVFGIVLFLMGALLPTLPAESAHLINLGSVPLVGILLATIVIGPILDIDGAKCMMVLALLLITGALAVLPMLRGYWQIAACCFAYGVGGGILNTATNVLIADLNPESRAHALNLLGFFFSGGAVLAPLLISSSGAGLTTETAVRLLAVITALILIAVLFLRFPPPLRAGIRLRDALPVFSQPLVWLFGLILFFESGSENCVFVWTGKIATDALHTTAARGSIALVVLGAALGVGRLLALLWLRWLDNFGLVWISTLLVVIGAALAPRAASLDAMVVAFGVIGLGISAIFPTVLAIAGSRFTKETGTVFGAIIAVGLVGGAAGPTIGAHAAAHGPLRVLLIPLVSAVAVAFLVFVAWHSSRAREKLPRGA